MQPGDIVFTHAEGWRSAAIRFGQALRARGPARRFAHWSHVAIVTSRAGDLIEAVDTGVKPGHVDDLIAGGTPFTVVETHIVPHDWEQMRDFLNSVVHARWRYGWWTLTSVAINHLTNSNIAWGKNGTAICSGLAAEALTRAGHIFDRPPAYMSPFHLAQHFNVTGPA